ncbi:unnamed protein product [Aphanomyces euteiches]|uniref:Myb-like DNA-binding protein n=1 Tax=Aphanomyces euteiches TaxID=100861 RepID=A0A6G0XYC8_9STRA|nr:hypothetical protein Ae201684_000067 [Aphanomyces euteiches]KAH9135528.1 hypothetical protein AeRB84_019090 [Aphanomyces euteiches]
MNKIMGAWTPLEDQLLRSRVEQSHSESWSKIAEGVPGRSSKQCRDRWRNHLDPSLIKTAFTTEEEIALENAYEELGNRWTEIAKRLPGRSEHDVKLRWKTMHPHRSDRSKAAASRPAPAAPVQRPKPEIVPNRPRQMSNVMGSDMISMLDDLAVIEPTVAKRPHLEFQSEWQASDRNNPLRGPELTGSFTLSDSFINTLKASENPNLNEDALVDSLFASFGPHDEEAIRRSFNLSMQEFDQLLENKTNLKKSLSKMSHNSLSFLSNNSSFLNNDDIEGLINSCVDNQIDHLDTAASAANAVAAANSSTTQH